MSNKERIIKLLDSVPNYKIGYILAYVQGIIADEEADDFFCQQMIENYETYFRGFLRCGFLRFLIRMNCFHLIDWGRATFW